jgi:hypothetical protein
MSSQGQYDGPGRYRHFKGGEYWVFGTLRHTESGQVEVVYQPDYDVPGQSPARPVLGRPLAMWNEAVSRDGYSGPRFTKIGPLDCPECMIEALAQRLSL